MFIKKQRMIELQNVNLRLRAGGNVKKRKLVSDPWYAAFGAADCDFLFWK